MEKIEEVEIDTVFIKLDQFLKYVGIAATGGHGNILIREGQVMVNGQVCTQRGKKLTMGDLVSLEQGPSFKLV